MVGVGLGHADGPRRVGADRPGKQRGRPRWVAFGVLWSAVTLAGWIAAVANDGGSGAGLLIILGWVGALATTLAIRPAYVAESRPHSPATARRRERRLEERREGQRIAADKPDLAIELGIGRPDKPGAQHAGLVDVNNASLASLLKLPGIDDALATRIVELRAELNGFQSVHDLGGLVDLDGNAVERLEAASCSCRGRRAAAQASIKTPGFRAPPGRRPPWPRAARPRTASGRWRSYHGAVVAADRVVVGDRRARGEQRVATRRP